MFNTVRSISLFLLVACGNTSTSADSLSAKNNVSATGNDSKVKRNTASEDRRKVELGIGGRLPIPEKQRQVILPKFWDSRYGPEAYFRPKESDIEEANRAIVEYLANIDANIGLTEYEQKGFARIKEDLSEYYIQYFGWQIESKRILVCNFFYVHPDNRETSYSYKLFLRKEPVNVKGGGSDHWGVYFDIDNDTIAQTHINAPR